MDLVASASRSERFIARDGNMTQPHLARPGQRNVSTLTLVRAKTRR
jgi:hypothetical protein